MLSKFLRNFFLVTFVFFLFISFLPAADSKQSLDCGKYAFSRFTLKQREHKGMGFDQGYSTAALFLCPNFKTFGLPLFDAKLHVFNSGYLASNLGIGGRFSNKEGTVVFGLNGFYDYRNYKSFSSHQGAAGLEILSPSFDIRVNAYYPFSGKYEINGPSFSGFSGNYAFFQEKIRYALPCADAEIGFTLPDPFKQIGCYFSVGSYYLFTQKAIHHSTGHVLGGRARLNLNPADYISLGAEYTYDHLFGSRTNGFIAFHVPLGIRKLKNSTAKRHPYKKSPCDLYVERMKLKTQDIIRNEIIPFYTENKITSELSPRFIFVNNLNLAGDGIGSGNGSFENPYTTIALGEENSSPGSVVYVFFGDGTTRGYDTGYIFKPNQTLTSSALDFSFSNLFIPAFTPNQFPTLTNTNAPVITASSTKQITVRGFILQGSNQSVVNANSTGMTFSNNTVIGQPNFIPFSHINPIGKTLLSENTFIGATTVNPQNGVIYIDNSAQNTIQSYQILNNKITALEGENGIVIRNFVNKIIVQNNTINITDTSSDVYGILAGSGTSNLSVTTLNISDNTILASDVASGIYVSSASNSILHGTISNNTIKTASTANGIAVVNISDEPVCLNIVGNKNVNTFNFKNTGSGFIQLTPSADGSQASFQNNNNPTGNYSYTGSIYFVPAGTPCSPFNAVFVNNASTSSIENGTFANPWRSLAAAQTHSNPGNLIYVFEGTGTTNPGYNTGFILQNDQMIVGSGTPFNYKGTTIQPLTEGMPQISNIGEGSPIINSPLSGITNGSIIGLNLVGNSNIGVNCILENNGSMIIESNSILCGTGINVLSDNTGSLSILNNSISASNLDTGAIYLLESSPASLLIQGNSISSPSVGLYWSPSTSPSTLNVFSNTFNSLGQGTGLGITPNGSSNISVNITNNTFLGNQSSIVGSCPTGGAGNYTIQNNQFSAPAVGIFLINKNKSTYNINNNFFSKNNNTLLILEYIDSSACITEFIRNNAQQFAFQSSGTGSVQINIQSQALLEAVNNPNGTYKIEAATFVLPGTPCP